MADAQKTIDLIFNGVDKTGAATMAALDNAKKFSAGLQATTQGISDFTVGAAKVEAGLLAAGLAMTVFAVKTAGDFDQSFRQISTLFEATAGELDTFKAAILSYASGSAKPLKDITESLLAAIGSGVNYADSLALMSTAEKLSVATRSDLKSTTEVLVSTMNAYGLQTGDAGKVSDLFFQIIKDGKIEMNDLARSLAMVTPTAAASGVSLQEVGAAVATLTASGIQPATAIEYLRSAITNIIKPSQQASDMAAELGINFDANALKSKGLAAVLDDVAKATGGNTGQMSRLIGDVGGLTAAMVLTGPQAQKFKDAIESMGNSAGSVAVAFGKMTGSLDVSLAKVSGGFTALLVAIGTPLLDEFGGIANAITAIFQALGNSVKGGALSGLAGYVEGVFKDIETALQKVATNLPAALAGADFSGFQKGIEAVLSAVQSLFGGLDLTSVQGLKDAINLVGVAFLGLSKYVAGSIEVFGPLFDTLIAVGKGAKDVDLSFLELAGNLGGIATQLNVVLPLFTGLLSILAAKQGISLVKDLATLGSTMSGVGVAAGALAVKLGQAGLVGAAGAAGYAVGSLANDGISALLSKITGSETTLGGFIYDLTHTAEQATVAAVGTAKAAGGLQLLGAAAVGVEGDFSKANAAMLANFAASEKAAGSTGKLAGAQQDVAKYALQTVPIYDALTGAITGYEQQLVKSATGTVALGKASAGAAGSLAATVAATQKAEEATRKWNEEVAKMAFTEKLKLIDAATKITTSQIEASAKVTVAAYESINATISSTGDVLGGLFKIMGGFDDVSFSTQWKIEEQVDKENKLREKAFDLQKNLTEAQIRQMNAQTNAMNKGDGLIKISGDGLQPHLEAFMWEILRTIQVRINSDGLKMLLGV